MIVMEKERTNRLSGRDREACVLQEVIELSNERLKQVYNAIYGDGFWSEEGLLLRMGSLAALVERLEDRLLEMARRCDKFAETLDEHRDHLDSIEDRMH
jgi:hypothetical protein